MFKSLWLCGSVLLILQSSAIGQGLSGATDGPSPRGGTSAGGPLIPGKTDGQRWSFLQSHQQKLLGASRSEIISLFGKGGAGLAHDELVYQVTAWARQTTVIELTFKFVGGKVESYSLSLLHRAS